MDSHMDLHEIFEFARNFSVMIRIKGPDPKGLKMRKHAFHHYISGKTTLSTSGMLLPKCLYDSTRVNRNFGNGDDTQSFSGSLVLTVASVIEPFLSLENRENKSQQGKFELIPGSEIDIMVEGKKVVENGSEVSDWETPRWLPAKLLTLIEIPASSNSVQSLIESSSSLSEQVWEVGWSLTSHTTQALIDSVQNQKSILGDKELRNPSLMGKSTTRIAILRVSSLEDLPNLRNSGPSKRGDSIMAVGSQFGLLSPLHFFNSIAVGSIANSYPAGSSNSSLYMADIRCLPGMEGSPVFGEHAQLIGILTRPLKQNTTGAEIQLLIPWKAISTACNFLLNTSAENTTLDKCRSLDQIPTSSPIDKAISSTCIVTINGGIWASCIILNKQGLVLTNAHLLEPWRFGKSAVKSEVTDLISFGRSIRVRLDHLDNWIWCNARVIYVSKGPLDVALLQLDPFPGELCPIIVDITCPFVGSKAYIIGHGLFGPRCDFSPSVCVGVVSKVVKTQRLSSNKELSLPTQLPAMIETTAAVHPGGSGGVIVNSSGHMIGLITSNARHGGGTVIPHLNFSIPCAALEPIFKFSKDMNDFSLLEELDKPNEHLSSIWALTPSLSPKPDPTLPNFPKFPQGDGDKKKGSSFAKFIAQRNDILKKNSLFDKVEIPSSKFTPSKL